MGEEGRGVGATSWCGAFWDGALVGLRFDLVMVVVVALMRSRFSPFLWFLLMPLQLMPTSYNLAYNNI